MAGIKPHRETGEDLTGGNHFERGNVVGALCGEMHRAITYCRQTAGGAFFEGWFTGCLLAALPKGHTVIMDNAPFHRQKAKYDCFFCRPIHRLYPDRKVMGEHERVSSQ
jgi:hypothetical protein